LGIRALFKQLLASCNHFYLSLNFKSKNINTSSNLTLATNIIIYGQLNMANYQKQINGWMQSRVPSAQAFNRGWKIRLQKEEDKST